MIRIEKPKPMEKFIDKLRSTIRLYEGCGNMLGIVPLALAGYPEKKNWMQDAELRKFLQAWGKQIQSDSVMVLTGDLKDPKQEFDFFMDVFEPNGTDNTGNNLVGGVSTMCGNGIRAVGAYIRTFKPDTTVARIMTRSGLRTVGIDKDKNLYAVDMGEFTANYTDLAKYVNTDLVKPNGDGDYIDSDIAEEILFSLKQHVSASIWSIGLNGNRDDGDTIDGEPHIVINIPHQQVRDIKELRELVVTLGPAVTKALSHFPLEINVNFITIVEQDDRKMTVWNCTHERNLGDDADHSVTAACGTGSTVVGAVMFRKELVTPNQYVEVKNTGGDLEISQHPKTQNFILTGPANPVDLTYQ